MRKGWQLLAADGISPRFRGELQTGGAAPLGVHRLAETSIASCIESMTSLERTSISTKSQMVPVVSPNAPTPTAALPDSQLSWRALRRADSRAGRPALSTRSADRRWCRLDPGHPDKRIAHALQIAPATIG
jgi:hypothetical protein